MMRGCVIRLYVLVLFRTLVTQLQVAFVIEIHTYSSILEYIIIGPETSFSVTDRLGTMAKSARSNDTAVDPKAHLSH
jgi:hypothetical protein